MKAKILSAIILATLSSAAYANTENSEALELLRELKAQQAEINKKIQTLESKLLTPQAKSVEQTSENIIEDQKVASVPPPPAQKVKPQAIEPHAGEETKTDEKKFIQFKGVNTEVTLGGAMRVNGSWNSESQPDQDTYGNSGFDLFRLDVNAKYNQWEMDAQYRWYEYMNTVHHGYIAYNFSPDRRIEAGITQVPFGLLPYASHSFWFSQGYYLGLEDDYDTGIKYHHKDGPWVYDVGFFKNAELNNTTSTNRYSFDVVRSGVQQNEEENQVNLRIAKQFEFKTDLKLETGLSGAIGQLYNQTTRKSGHYNRTAAHLNLDSGPWEFQLQGTHYNYNPRNPAGVDKNTILFGAFADTELVASEGTLFNANIARKIDVSGFKNIESMTCYNDYSYLAKHGSTNLPDSQMNVLGCSLGIGPIYTYIDWIAGKNAPFIGTSNALGPSTDTDWNSRINFNVGWYF